MGPRLGIFRSTLRYRVGRRIGVVLLNTRWVAASIQSCCHTRLIQVSQASEVARRAIEQAGGSVSTVYYNELGLRALTKPEWFEKKGRLLPRPAKPPPKLEGRFDRVGALPPSRSVSA